MDWLIEFIGTLTLAFFIALLIVGIQRGIENERKEQEEDEEDDTLKIHVRTYGEQYYAYNAVTNDFLGQGEDMEQMALNIYYNTKQKTVIFVSSDEGSYDPMMSFLKRNFEKADIKSVSTDSTGG